MVTVYQFMHLMFSGTMACRGQLSTVCQGVLILLFVSLICYKTTAQKNSCSKLLCFTIHFGQTLMNTSWLLTVSKQEHDQCSMFNVLKAHQYLPL